MNLDEDDIGDCITYCMMKKLPDEAFRWYLILEDRYHLQPNKSIVSVLLPALAKSNSWERLFYVMEEAFRLDIPISPRTRYQLLQECSKKSKLRWRYAGYFIKDLDLTIDNLSNVDGDITAVKCVNLVFSILAREHKFKEILALWGQFGRQYQQSVVQTNIDTVRQVGIASILLNENEIVNQLISLQSKSVFDDGAIDADVPVTLSATESLIASMFEDVDANVEQYAKISTLALVWMYFRTNDLSTDFNDVSRVPFQRHRLQRALKGRGWIL